MEDKPINGFYDLSGLIPAMLEVPAKPLCDCASPDIKHVCNNSCVRLKVLRERLDSWRGMYENDPHNDEEYTAAILKYGKQAREDVNTHRCSAPGCAGYGE